MHDILPRHRTPDVRNPDGSTTITVQRSCNGCGESLGDVTLTEIECAIGGGQLPDVRMECPRCRPAMDPPLPAKVAGELDAVYARQEMPALPPAEAGDVAATQGSETAP